MMKKTQVLFISIAVFAITLVSGSFVVMYFSTDKITEPADETSKLTLDLPERLLISPEIDLFNQIALSPPCTDGKDKMNLEEPTEFVTYFNLRTDLKFQMSYNPQWGAPNFRFNPYDEEQLEWREMYGQRLKSLHFGKPIIRGCDGWFREFSILFAPPESKERLIARIQENNARVADSQGYELKINTFEVDGKTIVQYTEGLYESGDTIIIGKKHNYILHYNGSYHLPKLGTEFISFGKNIPASIEGIVKSMQLID